MRCVQIGVSIADLDLLTIGTIYDMITERANDEAPDAYTREATQADFDRF